MFAASVEAIETGPDKLIVMITNSKNGKISLDEAASQLGLNKKIIREWAEFLEEEGLISLEYSFSKMFLCRKKLSKKELSKKENEYKTKKEAFVRSVDSTLRALQHETVGFEDIKTKFLELKKEIGKELERVEKEVKQLEHYEKMKNKVDNEILRQKQEFHDRMKSAHEELEEEIQKYNEIEEQIKEEEERITTDEKELEEIKETEDKLRKKLDSIIKIADSSGNKIITKEKEIASSRQNLNGLIKKAEIIKNEIEAKKHNEIDPLLKKNQATEEKIMKIQDRILEKVKKAQVDMEDVSEKGKEATKNFREFFEKKSRMSQMFNEIEEKRLLLESELKELEKKATSFDILSSAISIEEHMKDMKNKLKKIKDQKEGLKKEYNQLGSLIGK